MGAKVISNTSDFNRPVKKSSVYQQNLTGGRFWSILILFVLGFIWIMSGVYEWTDPIFWPAPGAVVGQFVSTATEGYRYFTLWQHIGYSVFRVITGVLFGCLVGIIIIGVIGFAIEIAMRWLEGKLIPWKGKG